MKIRLLVGGLVLVLVLVSLAGLLWLKFGESFDLGRISGSPESGMVLDDLSLRGESFGLRCRRIRLSIRPAELWQGRLHIQTLALEGIEGWHAAIPSGSGPSFDPRLFPLSLIVDELTLQEGVWQRPGQAEPFRIDRLSTRFSLDRHALQTAQFTLDNPSLRINGSGDWPFSDSTPLTVHLDWRIGESQSPLAAGQGVVQGDVTHLSTRQTLSYPVPAELKADIRLDAAGPHWTARLDLPRVSLQQWRSEWPTWPVQGSIQADNRDDAVQFSVDGAVELPGWNAIALSGKLDYTPGTPLKITAVRLAHPPTGSVLTLNGGLNPDKSFRFEGQWQNLAWPNAPPWTRSASGVFSLGGQPSDLRATLQGVWLQQPVDITARWSMGPKQLDIRQFQVTGPDTRLDLQGRYGQELALDWIFKTSRLGAWLDQARGALEGQGHVGGTPEHPRLKLEARGSHLGFNGQAVNRLELNAQGGLHPEDPLELSVRLDNVQAGHDPFDLMLGMQGTTRRHTLTARIDHPQYPVQLEGDGIWQGATWQGLFRRFDLTHPRLGTWQVQSPLRLDVAKTGFNFDETCWQHETARWCGAGQGSGLAHWTGNIHLEGLPLTRLIPVPPPRWGLSGVLTGQATFSGAGSRIETGQLVLDAPGLAVRYPVSTSQILQFRPALAKLEGTLHQGQARFSLSVRDPAFAELGGELSTRLMPDSRLTGQFRLNLPDLSVLESPDSAHEALIQGQGQLTLDVDGTVQAPKLMLQGGIHQARLGLPSLGIALTDMNVTLKPVPDQPNRVDLEAQARSGAGRLHVRGQGVLDPAKAWPWLVDITGTGVQVLNTRMAEVIVDPALRLETGQAGIRLSGQAVIPQARIRLPEHLAVKVSADAIRVDQPAEARKEGLALRSELTLQLGDEVHFEGNGVKARLGGQLRLEQAGQEPGRAQGEIRIQEGEYNFHSVKLPLNGGRLVYKSSPIDNPDLDFNVIRQVDGIKAGVRVLGPLQKPGFSLYSDPVMPESDILAYLVSGKSLNLSNSQEGRLMQQAAASLSGPLGNLLLGEITTRFGLEGLLDDVAVQTPRGTQTAALFLGKYLTPRLYLQYGVGLAQSSSVFRLRYELGKYWKIQSETGEQSGGDILFEMEK